MRWHYRSENDNPKLVRVWDSWNPDRPYFAEIEKINDQRYDWRFIGIRGTPTKPLSSGTAQSYQLAVEQVANKISNTSEH